MHDPVNAPVPAAPSEARRHFSAIGTGYLVLVLGIYAGALIGQLIAAALWPEVTSARWWNLFLSLVPLYGLGLPLSWVVLRRIPTSPHNREWVNRSAVTKEKPPFTLRSWMVLLVIGMGCMYAGALVGNILMDMLSRVTGYDYANGLNSLVEDSPLWMTFAAVCICAPIGEELLFRKLLVDRVRGYGDKVAILLSGLLFGLFHGNLFQFFYAFLLGIILAYVYTRSGDLRWCVAMHAAVNLLGSIVMPGLAPRLPLQMVAGLQYGLIAAAAVLVGLMWHRRRLSDGGTPLSRERLMPLFGNPGMIACLAAMLLMTVLSLVPPA